MQRIFQNSGMLSKTEPKKKKKETEQAVHGNSPVLPNVWASLPHTERGRPKLLPAASGSPLHAAPSHWGGWAAVFGGYHQPLWSHVFQEEELHQHLLRGLCPLLRGVRRAGPHPNAAQLGCTLLKRGIMGELCRPGERAGLFLGMTACVFGPRSSVRFNLAARLTLAVPSCCVKRAFGACTAVFLLPGLGGRHTGPCV